MENIIKGLASTNKTTKQRAGIKLVTIYMLIYLFCFFVYILNLVLNIIEIVDTYNVSIHICF
jgi:hypothetical protein